MGKAALSKLRSSNLNSTSTPSNSKEQENLTNSKDLVTSPDPKNPFKQVVVSDFFSLLINPFFKISKYKLIFFFRKKEVHSYREVKLLWQNWPV